MSAAVAEKPKRVRKPKTTKAVPVSEEAQGSDGFGPVSVDDQEPTTADQEEYLNEAAEQDDSSQEPDPSEAALAEAVNAAVTTRDREAEREALALGEFRATVSREALARALKTVAPGVSGRSTQPVQNNVLLRSGGGALSLTATDLEFVQLTCSIPAGGTGEGALTLPPKVLQVLASRLDAADVELTGEVSGAKPNLLQTGARSKVAGGRTRAHLLGMAATDFETLPPMPEESVRLEVPEGVLRNALAAVSVAVSGDETRPTINGVLWDVRPNGAVLAATDTHRLALREVWCEVQGKPQDGGYILASAAVGQLLSILQDGGERPVRVALSSSQAEFTVDGVTLGTRIIEGQFPSWERVVPDKCEGALTTNTTDVRGALERMMIVAPDDAYRVAFEAQQGVLRVAAESPDVGSIEEDLEAELDGMAEAAFCLNVRYALDALSGIDTEQVRLSFCGPLNPVMWEPVGAVALAKHVQMPMQK